MQDFQFLKDQFLSLQIPVNHHYLDRYIRFMLALPHIDKSIGYGESHHITPKILFPQFKTIKAAPWNQKRINARAHYLAHWMLWRALVGNKEMISAFWALSHKMRPGQDTYKSNSRIYEKLKIDKAREQSIIGQYVRTDETKKRNSDSVKGQLNHNYGKIYTDAERLALSIKMTGTTRELSVKGIANIREGNARKNKTNISKWKGGQTNDLSFEIWSLAGQIKYYFDSGIRGFTGIGTLLNIKELYRKHNRKYQRGNTTIRTILEHIDKGWDPNKDDMWLTECSPKHSNSSESNSLLNWF